MDNGCLTMTPYSRIDCTNVKQREQRQFTDVKCLVLRLIIARTLRARATEESIY